MKSSILLLLSASALGAMTLVTPAAATTPDPAQCSITPAVLVGNTTGNAITVNGHSGFTVVIRDANNQPIANTTVKIHVVGGGGGGTTPNDFYTSQVSGTTVNCLDSPDNDETIAKTTDASGSVTFTPRMGGWNTAYGASAFVTCQGVLIVQYIATRSTDIDDNGYTGLNDLTIFYANYNSGTYYESCDFDNDGKVGLSDYAIIANEYLSAARYSICNGQ